MNLTLIPFSESSDLKPGQLLVKVVLHKNDPNTFVLQGVTLSETPTLPELAEFQEQVAALAATVPHIEFSVIKSRIFTRTYGIPTSLIDTVERTVLECAVCYRQTPSMLAANWEVMSGGYPETLWVRLGHLSDENIWTPNSRSLRVMGIRNTPQNHLRLRALIGEEVAWI